LSTTKKASAISGLLSRKTFGALKVVAVGGASFSVARETEVSIFKPQYPKRLLLYAQANVDF